jgi:hypothetical protein
MVLKVIYDYVHIVQVILKKRRHIKYVMRQKERGNRTLQHDQECQVQFLRYGWKPLCLTGLLPPLPRTDDIGT